MLSFMARKLILIVALGDYLEKAYEAVFRALGPRTTDGPGDADRLSVTGILRNLWVLCVGHSVANYSIKWMNSGYSLPRLSITFMAYWPFGMFEILLKASFWAES